MYNVDIINDCRDMFDIKYTEYTAVTALRSIYSQLGSVIDNYYCADLRRFL